MLAAKNLRKQSLRRTFSSLFLINPSKNAVMGGRDGGPKLRAAGSGSSVIEAGFPVKDVGFTSSMRGKMMWNGFDGARGFSTKSTSSMRSKVENRMRKESGKTLREIRRAKKLRKKLMTDEERLLYNLRRAKKKVALLLQKLKKYELPELPTPRHDPELLTPEQMQAYKKIGYRNRNYVPVGVRGVFGGVVQNMHLHWKFHETVQVCCDNFPKEKIKEMASMLARLSGGIVVNIHNVKTIIMFRGRNYRQPKNLIPINTLTKRKALFKARFEQALESQKLNIKKIEQELRRKGVNPEDPVAMASIQRVASTFFNAIDNKEGSPYVFQREKKTEMESSSDLQQSQSADDSDQDELDRFIAEIEDAADKEWAAEEAAEKEEFGKIRYWNREDLGDRFRRTGQMGSEESDDSIRGRTRNWSSVHGRKKIAASDDEDGDISENDDRWDSNDSNYETDDNDSGKGRYKFPGHKEARRQQDKILKTNEIVRLNRKENAKLHLEKAVEDSVSDDMLSDLEDAMNESDDREGQNERGSRVSGYNYQSSSDDDNYVRTMRGNKDGLVRTRSSPSDSDSSEGIHHEFGVSRARRIKDDNTLRGNSKGDHGGSNAALSHLFSESDAEENFVSGTPEKVNHYNYSKENDEPMKHNSKNSGNNRNIKNPKEWDETWDSD
ncbi:hypothetical protein ACH5RR_014473 [Cinchona calisaya]|uniref:CRM domain-containing protein n=1 Tax=Cinchona calisaya TaxID=153742 RepID=A0ABD3A2X9_9GENT